MIIVLLLFFKSICLYCQRLVLHVHDRWINPKNVRLLKEAAEANGTKFKIEEYRQIKKSKRRRYATSNSASGNISPLADNDCCRFCANTPQGYCRHHFHLQELHVQKQQRQQKFWCPLSGVVAGANRSTEYRQLRKIKRDLKRNIQQQNSAKTQTIIYERSTYTTTTNNNYLPPTPSPTSSTYQAYSVNSLSFTNDSGYKTISVNTSSTLESEENSELVQHQQSDLASVENSNSGYDYVDIDLSTPSASLVETTYSFETCCETPRRSSSPIPKTASYNSFVSCDYSSLCTSYL